MKIIKFLIAAIAIFTFFSCQNNKSSENDEKNETQKDTEIVESNNKEEVVENNSDNEEISEQRTDEEQIQFIKDEFVKTEEDNLVQISYVFKPEAKDSPPTTYNLGIYKNSANEIVKTHYSFEMQGSDGADDITYYYSNDDLIFVYGIGYSGSAYSTTKIEDRYYFKNDKVIKHLKKTTTENINPDTFETENTDISNNEYSSVDEETQKELTDWAYHFLKIQSDEDFAQWVESLYK